jgi:hypothetical protein
MKSEEEKRKKDAMHHSDNLGAGEKKRKSLPPKDKIGVVMDEYKRGTLHSGGGGKVKSKAQAVAIALSEARKSGAKIPKK